MKNIQISGDITAAKAVSIISENMWYLQQYQLLEECMQKWTKTGRQGVHIGRPVHKLQ